MPSEQASLAMVWQISLIERSLPWGSSPVAYLLWNAVHVVLLTFAGLLMAIFLSACSDWTSSKTGWRRQWSLATVIAVIIIVFVGFVWLLGSRVAEQAAELVQELPKSKQQITHYLNDHPWGQAIVERLPKAAESLAQPGQLSRVTGLASGAAGLLLSIVVVAFVGIFGELPIPRFTNPG